MEEKNITSSSVALHPSESTDLFVKPKNEKPKKKIEVPIILTFE